MDEKIMLYPCLALVLLTMIVWVAMLLQRAMRMRAQGIGPNDMPTRQAADAKLGSAQAANNNLMNLFELPVVFYVAVLLILHLHAVDTVYCYMAWAFVILRGGQSVVHLTYNNVAHRGAFYLLGACVLWAIWLRLAYQIVVAAE